MSVTERLPEMRSCLNAVEKPSCINAGVWKLVGHDSYQLVTGECDLSVRLSDGWWLVTVSVFEQVSGDVLVDVGIYVKLIAGAVRLLARGKVSFESAGVK